MARRELIQYIDDLDGTPLDSADHKVVRFSYGGKNYVLDLSQANAESFEKLVEPYIANASIDHEAGSGTRRRGASASSSGTRDRNRKIRAWARDNGLEVKDRGALRKDIIDAYEAAN